jgi:hypothetical protein
MANEYAGLAEIKATLELSNESFADPDISRALTAASRGIDSLCGRRFWLDEDDTSTRYYSPDNENALEIDDLVDLATLKTDPAGDGTFEHTWTVNTDFILTPLNAEADERPWSTIRPRSASPFYLPCGVERSVEITGQFGWSTVPAEVKEATIILASKLMRRAREAPFGVIAIGLEAGGAMHIARTDPDIMFLVGEYMRSPIAVA